MKRLTDWLVYFVVRVFICVIQAMRMETCHAIARWLAVTANDVVKLRLQVVDDNIRDVYPQLSPTQRRIFARKMWEHLFLMVCEVAQTPRKVHDTNWRKFVRFENKRLMVRYLLDPRPMLLVTGHYGNFEVGGYTTGLMGFTTFTIARPLDNPHLDRFLGQFRGARGQHILPKQGSSGQVDEVLQSNGTLSLLGDQHAGPGGCWVEFMGRPASCHKALALFTLLSGAPMMVSFARRVGKPMRFEVGVTGVADPELGGPELSGVKELTQWYNHALEKAIRGAPEQYWWVHRRWKGKPQQRRSRKRKLRRDAPAGGAPGTTANSADTTSSTTSREAHDA